MSRRRLRRRSEKAQRHAQPPPKLPATPRAIVREATRVKRLAYTRTQAAEALGVSRSTFNRRILPLVETVEMPWGARLIPVDELQRLIVERRRPARAQEQPTADPGRPATLAPSIVERIRAQHRAGKSLGQIARELNAEQVQTAHGGAQWWPSTVRAVLRRANASESASSSTATMRRA
jgi:recombinase